MSEANQRAGSPDALKAAIERAEYCIDRYRDAHDSDVGVRVQRRMELTAAIREAVRAGAEWGSQKVEFYRAQIFDELAALLGTGKETE